MSCSEISRFLHEPRGVTTQKTPFFIVTAVKTSNLTRRPSSYLTGDILRLRYRVQKGYCYVRLEVKAVTMKNVVFWDIKTQFLPHRRYITSPLQNPEKLMLCKT
jgi:hypothetical protein